ncbi:hypothetical protein TBLA_0H01980 [Henningerozyma blattae CBS 6284]|uniref:Uncharacterized protein n=1 Tax=Henningerozyma blattae (strain ATCC 34711 / CBS 6284 / DSM 70876 / NBRC 10599 / NRRL Y-10934 / UCD 77-7) TaxID=1071380 RepID=I2H7Y2_HENB6|nr:hypothetical protein TBLA_0H01980 [Tetrapisispora blattae CBS 6284]CCH62484.1 hypothetical protein TBLA_0H01980 [Tetrapisispora blattae CBS 6284]
MSEVSELEKSIQLLNEEIKLLAKQENVLKKKFEYDSEIKANSKYKKPNFPNFIPELQNVLTSNSNHNFDESKSNLNSDNNQLYSNDNEARIRKQKLRSIPGQLTLEHKLFDDEISRLLSPEVVSLPSQRRKRMKLERPNLHIREILKNFVILEIVYRMVGITFFPVVDPTDLEFLDTKKLLSIRREMLGIRLEIYNDLISSFEKPHYILLKQSEKSKIWSIFKYTIPNYIDIHSLFLKINNGIITTDSDIFLFAKDVYSALSSISKKIQYFKKLENLKVFENLNIDLIGIQISFLFKSIYNIRISLKEWDIITCTIESTESYINKETRTFYRKWEIQFQGPIKKLVSKLEQFRQSITEE